MKLLPAIKPCKTAAFCDPPLTSAFPLYINHDYTGFMMMTTQFQGLTTPSSRFIKLDPSIPDLSIPELQRRVRLEDFQFTEK